MWGRVFIFFRGTVFFISLRVAGCFFNEDGCRCRRCRLSFSTRMGVVVAAVAFLFLSFFFCFADYLDICRQSFFGLCIFFGLCLKTLRHVGHPGSCGDSAGCSAHGAEERA